MIKKDCKWYDDNDIQDGCTEYNDETLVWRLNGLIHREDGPAVMWANGAEAWYRHGYIHREDGPAVTTPSGREYWLVNGEEVNNPLSIDFDWKEEGL